MKENKPNMFIEKKSENEVPMNVVENMLNMKREENSNTEEEIGFPWTPISIKFSNQKLISQAFRVSLFVHDLLMYEQEDNWELISKGDLNQYPHFHFKNKSIFADEINEEIFKQSNILMTYKDINAFATSKNDLPEQSQIVMDISNDMKEIDSEMEMDYRIVWKEREEKISKTLTRLAESKKLEL